MSHDHLTRRDFNRLSLAALGGALTGAVDPLEANAASRADRGQEQPMIPMTLRSQELIVNDEGNWDWRVLDRRESLPPERVAVLLVDVWNYHYCVGAVKRMNAMVPSMNRAVHAARDKGMVIIHAPATLMDAYKGTPARERALALPAAEVPEEAEREMPPLPVSRVPGSCCDTPDCPVERGDRSHQHDGIDIDHDRDYILEEAERCHAVLNQHDIALTLSMGFFTNVCVLNRPFGIMAMTRRGVPMALVRDMTDAMYNPATWPYVSHAEGTKLVIGYIEKFWCPSILSSDFAG